MPKSRLRSSTPRSAKNGISREPPAEGASAGRAIRPGRRWLLALATALLAIWIIALIVLALTAGGAALNP